MFPPRPTFKERGVACVDVNVEVFTVFVCSSSRIKENGQERVEIEEDGVLKRVLVNGATTRRRPHARF